MKNIYKFAISIGSAVLIALIYFIWTVIMRIVFPDSADEIIHKGTNAVYIIIGLGVAACFIIFFVQFIREINFMKLYSNELRYKGLSEELYNAALKRKHFYRKTPLGVGYIGSINLISNYYSVNERYEEAIGELEEVDRVQLRKAMKIDSNNPPRDHLVTYFSYIDILLNLYCHTERKEEADKLYEEFLPLFNAFIMKYQNLSNILYETKVAYLLYAEKYEEAESIMDITKESEPFLYSCFRIDMMKHKKEFDEEILESEFQKAYEAASGTLSEAFFKQTLDWKKKEIDKLKQSL